MRYCIVGAGAMGGLLAAKLALSAESNWRRLNGSQLLADLIQGTQFKDGIKVAA